MEHNTTEARGSFDLLATKLELRAALPNDERVALARALSEAEVRRIGPREDLVCEGDVPDHVMLIQSGWAYRYKQLRDGRRQIVGFLLPGDFCDLRASVLERIDHSIGTITAVTVDQIPRRTILGLVKGCPQLAQAFWWSVIVTEAIEREWIVNLGQRNALERMGHLLCELFVRQRVLGLCRGDSCDLPLIQADLAESTGLSNVHTNRTLQEMRAKGLIVLQSKILTIPDLARLQTMAMFSETYLHTKPMRDFVGT